jgi:hypothetical protein
MAILSSRVRSELKAKPDRIAAPGRSAQRTAAGAR